jgi:hypothetical protein
MEHAFVPYVHAEVSERKDIVQFESIRFQRKKMVNCGASYKN